MGHDSPNPDPAAAVGSAASHLVEADTVTVLLGVDQSLSCTGWAVLTAESGELVSVGLIRTSPKDARGRRLRILTTALRRVADCYAPAEAAVEGPAYGSDSLLSAGMVRAAVEIALVQLVPREVAPPTLKKWATGNGRADKSQMIDAARRRVGYQGRSHDEADAALIVAWLSDQLDNQGGQ